MNMVDDDKYGTHIREAMKRSMGEPFRPLNRRQDRYDQVMQRASWITGTLAAILVIIVIVAQAWIALR